MVLQESLKGKIDPSRKLLKAGIQEVLVSWMIDAILALALLPADE
jgi:hypothetical protein